MRKRSINEVLFDALFANELKRIGVKRKKLSSRHASEYMEAVNVISTAYELGELSRTKAVAYLLLLLADIELYTHESKKKSKLKAYVRRQLRKILNEKEGIRVI